MLAIGYSEVRKIIVIKDAQPDNYQDFSFSNNVPGYATTFTLDDDATLPSPSSISNTKTLLTPANGIYNIAEIATTGFTLSKSDINNY